MSQFDYGTIDPNTKSGTVLATDLNSFRDALNSAHSGTSRPSYAVAKTIWVNDASTPWVVYMYDGADDIAIGTINAATNKFIPGASAAAAFADIKQAASSTATGVVELATDAEVQSGAPVGLVVTNDGLASFGKNHASSGYQALPGGLILQWGTDSLFVSATSNATKAVTYPLAFPTAPLFRIAHMAGETNISSVNYWGVRAENNSSSLTGFTILYINEFSSGSTIDAAWFAIGY